MRFEKFARLDSERTGQSEDVFKRYVALASLNGADVRSVKSRAVCEFFLGKAGCDADTS